MQDNFDFKAWLQENRSGPYAKDTSNKKQVLKESNRVSEEDEDFIDKYNQWKRTDAAKEPFRDKNFDSFVVDLNKLDAAIKSKYPDAERGEYPFDDDEDSDSFFIGDVKGMGKFIAWYDWQPESVSIGSDYGRKEKKWNFTDLGDGKGVKDGWDFLDNLEDDVMYNTIGLLVQHVKDDGICVYQIQGNGETTDSYGEPSDYIHAHDSGPYKISGIPDTAYTRMNENLKKSNKMQDNFDFKAWLQENRSGPYSKDNASHGKRNINESVENTDIEEAMDLTPPAKDKIYEPEESEQEYYDRAMGLVGMQVKDVIDTLRNDGFEDEDIIDIVRTLIMDYDVAFSGMEKGSLNEYEIACVEMGRYYYRVNDEGDTVSGPYSDPDCTRKVRAGMRELAGFGKTTTDYPTGGKYRLFSTDGNFSLSDKFFDSAEEARKYAQTTGIKTGYKIVQVPKSGKVYTSKDKR